MKLGSALVCGGLIAFAAVTCRDVDVEVLDGRVMEEVPSLAPFKWSVTARLGLTADPRLNPVRGTFHELWWDPDGLDPGMGVRSGLAIVSADADGRAGFAWPRSRNLPYGGVDVVPQEYAFFGHLAPGPRSLGLTLGTRLQGGTTPYATREGAFGRHLRQPIFQEFAYSRVDVASSPPGSTDSFIDLVLTNQMRADGSSLSGPAGLPALALAVSKEASGSAFLHLAAPRVTPAADASGRTRGSPVSDDRDGWSARGRRLFIEDVRTVPGEDEVGVVPIRFEEDTRGPTVLLGAAVPDGLSFVTELELYWPDDSLSFHSVDMGEDGFVTAVWEAYLWPARRFDSTRRWSSLALHCHPDDFRQFDYGWAPSQWSVELRWFAETRTLAEQWHEADGLREGVGVTLEPGGSVIGLDCWRGGLRHGIAYRFGLRGDPARRTLVQLVRYELGREVSRWEAGPHEDILHAGCTRPEGPHGDDLLSLDDHRGVPVPLEALAPQQEADGSAELNARVIDDLLRDGRPICVIRL